MTMCRDKRLRLIELLSGHEDVQEFLDPDGRAYWKVNYQPSDTWNDTTRTVVYNKQGYVADVRMDEDVADEMLRSLVNRVVNELELLIK